MKHARLAWEKFHNITYVRVSLSWLWFNIQYVFVFLKKVPAIQVFRFFAKNLLRHYIGVLGVIFLKYANNCQLFIFSSQEQVYLFGLGTTFKGWDFQAKKPRKTCKIFPLYAACHLEKYGKIFSLKQTFRCFEWRQCLHWYLIFLKCQILKN